MNGTKLDAVGVQRVVEARLGRRPQDMLEAAVVLEAWAGVPARAALDAGRALMHDSPTLPQPSAGRVPEPDAEEGFLLEAASFVIAVIAIAGWAAPLASSLGAHVVERALFVALPLSLALQWALRSRYLGRPHGLSQLGQQTWVLVLGALALVALPSALMGLSGAVAGLLTLTWTSGTILIRRHWSAAYAVSVLVATGAMLAGVPALNVLSAIAGATTVAAAAAILSKPTRSPQAAGRLGRAFVAGLIGAGLGTMLVADPSVSWTAGAVPALALLPSTVASFWSGYHLWRFQQEIPRALAGVAVSEAERRGLAWSSLRILVGAVARLVSLTAVLSAALVFGTSWYGANPTGIGLLAGFGLVALATLFVSLLESVGRARWALIAILCAIAAEEIMRLLGPPPFPGAGLVVGAALAVLIALPAAFALLSRPASTLATSLWIT